MLAVQTAWTLTKVRPENPLLPQCRQPSKALLQLTASLLSPFRRSTFMWCILTCMLLARIRKAQKEATSSLSKYGKAVDKTFEGSITKLTATTLSPGPDLDFAIADHLLRLGRWSLAQQFVATSEADVSLFASFRGLHSHTTPCFPDWRDTP